MIANISKTTSPLAVACVHHFGPQDVFAIVELDKAGDKLLEKPLMITCVKYANMFDKAKTVSLFCMTMTKKRLANCCEEGSEHKKITVRVQAELTLWWLDHQKPPAEIFELLSLDKTGDTPFESPLFAAWRKYVDDYNLNSKDGQRVEVVPILMSRYERDVLVKMRVDENKSSSFGRLALDLKRALHKNWINEDLRPKDVDSLVKSVKPADGRTLLRAVEGYPRYIKRHDINYDKEVDALEDH